MDGTGPNKPEHTEERVVTLSKGAHRWRFACDRGSEPALLRRLSEVARDADMPFDWFDAALVSHQLSERLSPGLCRVEGPGGTDGGGGKDA